MSQDLTNSGKPQNAIVVKETGLTKKEEENIHALAVKQACRDSGDHKLLQFAYSHPSERLGQLLLDPQQSKEVSKKLHQLSYFMGLKEPVEKEMMDMHLTFLEMNFPNMTLAQVEHAFMLAAAGALNADATHYGVWSPQYVGKILSEYRLRANKLKVRVREISNKHHLDAVSKKRAESFDMVEVTKQNLINEFDGWRERGLKEERGWSDLSAVQLWVLRNLMNSIHHVIDLGKLEAKWGMVRPQMKNNLKGDDPIFEFCEDLFMKIRLETNSWETTEKVNEFLSKYGT